MRCFIGRLLDLSNNSTHLTNLYTIFYYTLKDITIKTIPAKTSPKARLLKGVSFLFFLFLFLKNTRKMMTAKAAIDMTR